ncbi:ankyrin repeat-containing domain protein [Russula compacta]|nr:ankyrin repeat-containing domain protein [Russula compacta]
MIDHNLNATKDVTNDLKRNQLRGDLRTWLSPPDHSISHNTAYKTQHHGTATWFIQGGTFRDWKKNGTLLWIRGSPGAGKSILCSAVIEDIKSMQEGTPALIAYYYFDYKDASKRDVRGLLTSLLFQLAYDSNRCWDVLHELHTTCRDGSERPSDTALAKCLKAMLALPGQVPIFIIMDALDECPSNTGTPSAREEVLDFVEDLVEANLSNLFVCVTSRPEQDIQTVLNPLTSASCRVSLHEESGQREDINSYVRSFVEKDRSMRRWREEDRELVIATLSGRANGMFRWVYCQLDTLRRCMPSSIRKALDELPTTLDETYERVLEEIPKEKRQHADRLFQCLVAAIRPLHVEELAEIFAISFEGDVGANLMESWRAENAEDAVFSACSTLIAVIEDSNPLPDSDSDSDSDSVMSSKIVQFSHFSVKEFLISDRLRTSGVGNIRHYHILLDAAHAILARACIAVLLQLDESVDKERLKTFPLARYAAEYWVGHTTFGDMASRIQDTIELLIDPHKPYLPVWAFWIHNVEGRTVPHSIDNLPEHPPPAEATALYYAVLCGFIGLAKHLIVARGEDVNAKCGNHGTPLHAASYRGHLDAASLLLDHGADLNMAAHQGTQTPLCSAYDGRRLEVMRLLLERGANVDVKYDNYGPISNDASFNGRAEDLQLLLRYGTDVNVGDDERTPLYWASASRELKTVRLLLAHGVDVDAQTQVGNTSLYRASEDGYFEVVETLLSHGANVHIRGENDLTPFQVATSGGHSEIAQLLLEYGAEKE